MYLIILTDSPSNPLPLQVPTLTVQVLRPVLSVLLVTTVPLAPPPVLLALLDPTLLTRLVITLYVTRDMSGSSPGKVTKSNLTKCQSCCVFSGSVRVHAMYRG